MHPVFILNPKTASTSIRKTLRLEPPDLRKHRTIHLALAHHYHQKRINRNAEAFIFGVVRHPLDRFVSAAAYFKQPCPRNVPENRVLEAMLQNMTIDDFALTVDLEKISNAIPHFKTQHHFFKPGANGRGLDALLRFERLADDFNNLCVWLNIQRRPLLKERTSLHKPWEEELSIPAARRLRDFYRDDFTLYRYE